MSKKKRKGVKIDHGTTWKNDEEVLAIHRPPAQKVSIGDVVQRKSYVLCRNDGEEPRTYFGTVVYVHPLGRYHVVALKLSNGKTIRESYLGTER